MIMNNLHIAITATPQCIAGSVQTTAGEPISESGQFINLDLPAVCRGNLTAWHFCYYPDNRENTFSVNFRIWRPRGRRLLTRIHSDERTITSLGVRNNQSVLSCEDITLTEENYVQIEPNDVVGIYIPLFSDISAVGMYQSPQEGAGVYRDKRSTLSILLDSESSVERNDLMQLKTAILHLYADISKSSFPQSQYTPRYLRYILCHASNNIIRI